MLMFVFIAGIALGIGISIAAFVLASRKPVGVLRVDHSDPSDPPLLFLELHEDVSEVLKQREVLFQVQRKDFLPQK